MLAVLSIASCAKRPASGPPVGITTNPPIAYEPYAQPEGLFATVNGAKVHYLTAGAAGKGTTVVLLHGYAETSHMWKPLLPQLAPKHLVIAPDLRGAGYTDKPDDGYDKKTMAADVHALVQSLGQKRVKIVGHDIGLMVAYSYAAQYPDEVESVVLMDAFIPGIGDWKSVWLMRDLWHFHFNGETPLKLVDGRERAYLEHFWNDFAADKDRSIPEVDRLFYASEYAQPGAMRATMQYFKAFEKDAEDNRELAQKKLTMPVLVLTGEKASGTFLIEQTCLVADKVEGVVIEHAGHWLMEEAPKDVMHRLVEFLDSDDPKTTTKCEPKPKKGVQEVRLTSGEIEARNAIGGGPGTGTSGAPGIRTTVLKGDPKKEGLYTIVLNVPANTRIDAHSHPDDRVATVVSGTWYLGYGKEFDEKLLKPLSPGSFYTESPNAPHFAKTGDKPVVVQITGMGPTATTNVVP